MPLLNESLATIPMKKLLFILSIFTLGFPITTTAQSYTFFVRQVQMPGSVEWDVNVPKSGSQLSPLAINPNGARFELWTVKSSPLTSTLVDSTYVQSYVPVASVEINSEDAYGPIPRTRIDRPFTVKINVTGLSNDPAAPSAAKSVKLTRHVQGYAGSETGTTINRNNATLLSQSSLSNNGSYTLSYNLSSIPGGDRTVAKGEERFSVFSLEDYQAPESQLSSKFIQIWPMTSIAISGMTNGHVIKGDAPEVNVTLTNLYPDSYTYTQVYEGSPVLGTLGDNVPGAAIVVKDSAPRTDTIRLKNWDASIANDGLWTLEVITETPFGTERLGYMTFKVDRAIKVNGAVTSAD